MKLNKIFAFATVLVLALTGCNQAIEREPSPEFPTDVKDVYFPTIDERGTEIDPSAGVYTHTVTIARKDSTGALTVALNVIVNTDSIFKVPASVDFADGASTAEFEIDFTGAKDGVTYSLDIQVDLALVNPYTEGYSEYLFDVTPIKWVAAEKPAIFNDALFTGAYGVPGYYWYVDYEYAELGGGSVRYRFKNVYTGIASAPDSYGVFDAFPYNESEDEFDGDNDYYTIIDVDADGNAIMPWHGIGVDWGYGEFGAGSTKQYLIERESANADNYNHGVAEEGLITFAAGDVYLDITGYGPQPSSAVQYIYLDQTLFLEANSSVKLSDYEGFNDPNIEWTQVVNATTMFESQLANGKSWNQALYNAVDPNSVDSIDETSDFYNLYYLPDLYNEGYGLAFYYDTTSNKIILPLDPQSTGEKWANKEIFVQPSEENESYVETVTRGGAELTALHFALTAVTEDEVIVAEIEEVYYFSPDEIVWSENDYIGNFILTGKNFWGDPDAAFEVTIAKGKSGLEITGIDDIDKIIGTVDAATGYFTIESGQTVAPLNLGGVDYNTMFITNNPDDEDDVMSSLVFANSLSGVISLHETSAANGYLIYVANPDDDEDAGLYDGFYDLQLIPQVSAVAAPKHIAKKAAAAASKGIRQGKRVQQTTGRIDTSYFQNMGKAQRHHILKGKLVAL